MKVDPYTRKAVRAELKIAKESFRDAELRAQGAKTDAEKKKAIKEMNDAAADIRRLNAQLKG